MLATIKGIWAEVANNQLERVPQAQAILQQYEDRPDDPVYGWAAMICAREAGNRETMIDMARYLAMAVGCFTHCGDVYGRTIAEAHMAMTALHRKDSDAALKFALMPWSTSIVLEEVDAMLLHGIAAYVYWARDDIHSSVLHTINGLELCKRLGNEHRRLALLSNLSIALMDVAEPRLAASVAAQALSGLETMGVRGSIFLNCLNNVIVCNLASGNLQAAESAVSKLVLELNPSSAEACGYYEALGRYFAAAGMQPEARRYLELLRTSVAVTKNPTGPARLMVCEMQVFEHEGRLDAAIEAALKILARPVKEVFRSGYRDAANCMSRCYRKLGRSADATKWQKYAVTHGYGDALSTVFATQLEATLKPPEPNPLTPQEMECLSLSAKGQTSADIGLKLGITARTVNFHIQKVLRKLGAMNRQEAIAKAITSNYLRL